MIHNKIQHKQMVNIHVHVHVHLHVLILCTGSFQQDEIDALLKESVYMKQLNHPNVMELVGVCLDAGTSPYIILPYMAGQPSSSVICLLIYHIPESL